MSWTRLDDQFFAHPKVIDLSKDAKLLYLSALTYCAAHLTNGAVSPGALRVIAATVDVSRDEAAALVVAGLWESCEDGWLIHDYLEYQPTRDKALATKQARAEAGSRGGHKSANSKAEAKAQANVKQTERQNVKPISTPSPSPSESHPIREEEPPESVKKHSLPPRGQRERASQEDFAVFWQAYPNKQAKEDAWKAWQKLTPDAALREVLLAAIVRAKAGEQWQRGVIPHPATWLNQKRWTDELPTPVCVPARASPTKPAPPSTIQGMIDDTARAVRAGGFQ